jgi:hypothetical protein
MANQGFTMVDSGDSEPRLFDTFHDITSGKIADPNGQLINALREQHPDMTVTVVSRFNLDLLQFVAAGFAFAELDKSAEPVVRLRGFVGPAQRGGGQGHLADGISFARYKYKWSDEYYILYTVGYMQYILKEPRGEETPADNSVATDALLLAMGAWLLEEVPAVYVYDRYWYRSTKLWEQVSKAKWSDVILDPKMKKALTEVAEKFFDSRDIYEEYGVPWKRGLIFHGPAGNGKTISLKALMHTLYKRKSPVVTLYVKTAPSSYDIGNVFYLARKMTPCLLVLEDIDTIVTKSTRSYFFNEVDGIENNDGILMIASTNHLDQLDPGLSQRPSRFDRKYLFPLPDKAERALYAEYWRTKLQDKPQIDFPKELCEKIAGITEDFSFAYLKEAFVATLLELARSTADDSDSDDEISCSDDPLGNNLFWQTFKEQVDILRKEMGDGTEPTCAYNAEDDWAGHGAHETAAMHYEQTIPFLEQMKLQGPSSFQPCEAASSSARPPLPTSLHNLSREPGCDPIALNMSIRSPLYTFDSFPPGWSAQNNIGRRC